MKQLWNDWTNLWNGDLSLAERIIADRLTVHSHAAAPVGDPDSVTDRHGLVEWIGQVRASLGPDLTYHTSVGPFLDDGHLSCRWLATFTGEDGAQLTKGGIDVLRLEGDLITEVWTVTGTRLL
ncbi:hypothetical protein ACIBHX_39980 [Nonomuraea sp. NPDC050536]|uniref:hypothetical protein n=1 Tax=Nonomuraea sp. NPDC050536 TaxID=3364366 RepID=UPI0037C5F7DD